MTEVFICDYIRTPIGRFGGALSPVRADDLGAIPAEGADGAQRRRRLGGGRRRDLRLRQPGRRGQPQRRAHVARCWPGCRKVSGTTVNRLCGSGMDAVITAARAIKAGEAELMIAGGVESMSRAPFVMPKAETAFSRNAEIHDTTIGWRFVNPLMKAQYGVDSMPETGENVAEDFQISRARTRTLRARSQARPAAAQANGRWPRKSSPSTIPRRKGDPIVVSKDEHPRPTPHRGAGQAADALPQGRRHGDGRQCLRRQ
jgi:acetyl-CoA acyltransferase